MLTNYIPIEVISPWGVRQRRAARGGGCERVRAGLQREGAALGAYVRRPGVPSRVRLLGYSERRAALREHATALK